MTSPYISTLTLFIILYPFAQVSGLKVNQAKYKALNLTLPLTVLGTLQASFPFTWRAQSLTYLSVHLTNNCDSYYQANYTSMHQRYLFYYKNYLLSVYHDQVDWLPSKWPYYLNFCIYSECNQFRCLCITCKASNSGCSLLYGNWVDREGLVSLYQACLSGGLGIPGILALLQGSRMSSLPHSAGSHSRFSKISNPITADSQCL